MSRGQHSLGQLESVLVGKAIGGEILGRKSLNRFDDLKSMVKRCSRVQFFSMNWPLRKKKEDLSKEQIKRKNKK